jgi:UDP-N-acetyl-D-glucosamine dehydrogenase
MNGTGIVGLNPSGLALARAFVPGSRVIGFEVTALGLGSAITEETSAPAEGIPGRIEVTHDLDRLREPDVLVVSVSVPLTAAGGVDTSSLAEVMSQVGGRVRRDQLIVLADLVPVGTTRTVALPLLSANRLTAGQDFFLAYSPPVGETTTRKRVIGALDSASLERALSFLAQIPPAVVPVGSLEVAELCGLVGAAAQQIRVAVANELKLLCDRSGSDVWELLTAEGLVEFQPGPGGSHPAASLLAWGARRFGASTRLIELAGEVNAAMPAFVVSKVADALNDRAKSVKDSRVLILGMADKKDVDDPRASPGFELMDLLLKKGAVVTYNDLHIPELPRIQRWPDLSMTSSPLSAEFLATHDCVLIVTDHSAYNWDDIVSSSVLVVDTRNATRNVRDGREKIVRA